MPASRRASRTPSSSERGMPASFAGRASSAPSATRRPSSRPGSIAPRHPDLTAAASGALDGTASARALAIDDPVRDPHRVERAPIVKPEDVGPPRHGQCDRGRRRPLALLGRGAPLPGAREQGTEEVLARHRHEERATQLAELAEAGQDLEIVLDREIEVETRVEGDLIVTYSATARVSDPLGKPFLEVGDRVVVGGRLAFLPRGTLDVHHDQAATRL